jgi:hypothetical protein
MQRRFTARELTIMSWLIDASYFCGGLFLANALPHIGNGISGRPFQTPFASPPGKGLSTSTVNVLWGFFNLAAAYLLIVRVGTFNLHDVVSAGLVFTGMLAMAVMAAIGFGRLHGGQ